MEKFTDPVWHPLTPQKETIAPRKIVRADKEFLFTDKGETIIDAISSWWVMIHGHNHPKIMESIRKQTEKLDHVMLAGFTHDSAIELAEKLIEFSNRKSETKKITESNEQIGKKERLFSNANNEFRKVFFSDNGSNAVEIAIKIATQYYSNKGLSSKQLFIGFSKSYHGDSIGAMGASGENLFNNPYKHLLFPKKEFPAPNCFNCPKGKVRETCKVECLEDLETFLEEKQTEVAGVILEPLVMGAFGMVFYDSKVLQKLERICKKNDVLLVLDEVFTGFGRLGENFAFQLAGITPDLVAIAKGLSGGALPIAATLVTEEVYSEFVSSDLKKSFFHAHTMTGNPIACSAAIASIELLEAQNTKAIVSNLETRYAQFSQKLKTEHGNLVTNPRQLGSIFAFEIQKDFGEDEYLNPIGKEFREFSLGRGVLLRPLGNTIYVAPPYTISETSLTKIFLVIEDFLKAH